MPFAKGHNLNPGKYVAGYEDEFVTIKKRIEDTFRPSGETVRNYICICKECGKEFSTSHTMIRDHFATFCKECKKERRKEKKNKYYGTRIYSIWRSMLNRCYWEKHKHYNNYGGRGIAVCDEWRFNSSAFGDWAISNGYADNLSIDRIDNNGNYCPENCRWVTWKEQMKNRRPFSRNTSSRKANNRKINSKRSQNALIEINGIIKTRNEWCDFYGISRKTVDKRIYELKWDVVEAITTPPRKRGK